MNKQQLTKIMGRAVDICDRSGSRLTEKRKKILELLLVSNTPLSAYEVANSYNQHTSSSMPPMSAYRILNFLESEHLAHKLSSTNKYIACSHITCDHNHEVLQFLICRQCQQVKEVVIDKKIIDALQKQVSNVGYQLRSSQLELDCLCEDCA